MDGVDVIVVDSNDEEDVLTEKDEEEIKVGRDVTVVDKEDEVVSLRGAVTDTDVEIVLVELPVGSIEGDLVAVTELVGVSLAEAVLVREADVQSTVLSAEGEELGVFTLEWDGEPVTKAVEDVVFVGTGVCDGLRLGEGLGVLTMKRLAVTLWSKSRLPTGTKRTFRTLLLSESVTYKFPEESLSRSYNFANAAAVPVPSLNACARLPANKPTTPPGVTHRMQLLSESAT
jgi:hypothetical protein